MRLEKLQIVNFKNIPEASLEFAPGVNCLLGSNGMGKSNLLEALHFLSFTRGFRSMPDSEFIRHDAGLMLLKGEYLREDGSRNILSIGLERGKRKHLKCDGKEYGRISEHIGRFPLVVIEPRDSDLISGSGESRRRLIDMVISQADRTYMALLVRYAKALESRNRLLRSGVRDPLIYESIEQPLCNAASGIHAIRRKWVEEASCLFSEAYSRISSGSEKAKISYNSSLNERSMQEILDSCRMKDSALGYTSSGLHRDDLTITLDSYSARRLGSQGQIKSLAIALKFAVYDFLRTRSGITPILLLDDVFDKLDSDRVARMLELVSGTEGFGQIFVTDTNRKYLDEILVSLDSNRLFKVENGHFKSIER